MKKTAFKLMVILVILLMVAYFTGGFNYAGKRLIVNYLYHRQGVTSNIDDVALTSLSQVSINKISLSSAFDEKATIMKMDNITIDFTRDKSANNKIIPQVFSLSDGIIYGKCLGKHLRSRKIDKEERARKAKEEAEKNGAPKKEESPEKDSKQDQETPKAIESSVLRKLHLNNVCLDGGTITLNLLIARKEVPVKLKEINGEFQVQGKKLYIKNLSWKMGPLTPRLSNKEYDLAVLSDPQKVRGVPKEIRGIFLFIAILLGLS